MERTVNVRLYGTENAVIIKVAHNLKYANISYIKIFKLKTSFLKVLCTDYVYFKNCKRSK